MNLSAKQKQSRGRSGETCGCPGAGLGESGWEVESICRMDRKQGPAEMATCPSTLAWTILGTEEPGRLQSWGSQSRTRLNDFTFFLSFTVQHGDLYSMSCD